MRKSLRFFGAALLVILLFPTSAVKASEIEDLFWSRQWVALETKVRSLGDQASPKERVIFANALWLQRKWAPALEILLEEREDLPEGLKPFADMLILLGFERTGDGRKAEEAALSLWKGDDWVLAPHVAYALGRLSLKGGRVEEAKEWYGAMAESAKDTPLRKQALEALLKLPEPDPKYALALLELAPFHRGAPFHDPEGPGA